MKRVHLEPAVPKPAVAEAQPGAIERRSAGERRRRRWWSVLYGGVHPRRRTPPRRAEDSSFHWLDWHDAHLLGVSTGILLLSVIDAFMTVSLLQVGAIEINPIMALMVDKSVATFAVVKLALTGFGVICLVVLARQRLLRVVRVDVAMYAVLAGYLALIGHEMRMLEDLGTAIPW